SGIVKTRVEAYSTKTDKAGKFLLRNLPSGVAYWLSASLPRKDLRYMPTVSKPIDNIRVVLIPAGPHPNRTDQFNVAWPATNGHFRMNNVPPGDYKVYAWEYSEDDAWSDPNFLQLYKGSGTAVHIRPQMEEHVDTPLIPPWL